MTFEKSIFFDGFELFEAFLISSVIFEFLTRSHRKMERNIFYFLVIALTSAVNLVHSTAKYEHINHCLFYNLGINIGDDNVTFVCTELDGEKSIFPEAKKFKCPGHSQPNVPTDTKWPGTMDFQNCRLHEIPSNYLDRFESLHTLIVRDVELKMIRMETFKSAKNLKQLDVSHNQLTEIPAIVLFVYCEKLVKIDFSNNLIAKIDPLAFLGANNLQSLNLSSNRISQLDARTFSTPKMLKLDLSRNNLTTFEEHIFDNMTALTDLNLSYNSIGNFNTDIFSYLSNLERLNLQHTNITSIKLGTFSHQHKLISLDLSGNNLKSLHFGHFLPILPDLQSLYIAGNRLESLSGLSQVLLPKLEILDIRNNSFNCTYLQNFMNSTVGFNWGKLHLPINVPLVESGGPSIRGIGCKDIAHNETKYQVDTVNNTIIIDVLNKISSNLKSRTNDEFLVMNFSLGALCIVLMAFFVVYVVVNRDRICCRQPLITYQYQKNDKPSPVEHTVEFSNHTQNLIVKER